MRSFLAFTAAAMLVTSGAVAQNPSATPNYGSVTLNSGFTPDPYTVTLSAGGGIAASNISSSCRGYITNAPDFSVYYTASSLFDLSIFANSGTDTTLVINDPYGNWFCNDDGGEGLNPALTFNNPSSGRYDIWVGTYSSSAGLPAATLSISELGRSGSAPVPPSRIDYTLPATYGNATLRAGFQPDPYRVSITSGGRHRANEVRSGCAGWVASAPDFQLTFSAGSLPLIISAASSTDTTLLVNDPNGNWHCNDDGGNQGLNPALTFYNAMSGTYDIWVGSYSQGNNASATLSISELYSE